MSIEVQKAPHITQIVLENTNNDLSFSLDKNGVITNSNSSKKAPSKHIKSKEKITNSSSETMASKYSNEYDSYDDDFEDESPVRNGSRTRTQPRKSSFLSDTQSDLTPSPPTTRRTKKNTNSRRNSSLSFRSTYGASRASNKFPPKKTKKSQSANTRPVKTDNNTTVMVQKILSANRNKITKLYNVVEELQQEVDHLRDENKTLKRIHVKQEKELKRVDREAGSLPQLLQRHSAELRTYRERLKKNKMEISRKEKESHSHDAELTKLRDKVHHYKQLDSDKKLEERASLAKKLERVEKALNEKDTKIMELQKTIKLSEKARQREIKDQQDRYKKTKDELIKVQENVVSLREKLKEKEKQLDMTNIYHQNIQRKLKKSNPLALPLAHNEDLFDKKEPTAAVPSHSEKKRTNIFLTHAPSDKSSSIGNDVERSQPRSEIKASIEKNQLFDRDERLEFEKQEAARIKEQYEQEERKRREQEEVRRKEEEEEAKRREVERKREEQEMREQIRRLEEEKKRKEEEERRKQQEEERIRKEKEEQARLKFKEDEEIRRKKDLLLARMKAIDNQSEKPNGIIDIDLNAKLQDEKPKKLPIFLQSSNKPKESTEEPTESNDNEKRKSGSGTSVRSKNSQSSSYDFKETIKNLHSGLPAHPSDQHLRGRLNSQEDEPSFGSYKPTIGRRDTTNKKPETFGSYNPSFAESKKDASKGNALDFGKKQDIELDKNNDLVFGSYQPTFGNSSNPSKNTKDTVNGGLDFSSKKNEGRRGRQNQPNAIFGDDIFSKNEKPTKRASIFDDDPFNSSKTTKDKNYPWEKKVDVSVDNNDDSLLPRRAKLNQGHKQNVPAIGNILNGTLDDDIEEVTL